MTEGVKTSEITSQPEISAITVMTGVQTSEISLTFTENNRSVSSTCLVPDDVKPPPNPLLQQSKVTQPPKLQNGAYII
ncbi:hypothetical protein J6590_029866 [Homalodisca vitripennis]|nr:hypothetical protein J6590_029866 [Homalodisca vitripennis]